MRERVQSRPFPICFTHFVVSKREKVLQYDPVACATMHFPPLTETEPASDESRAGSFVCPEAGAVGSRSRSNMPAASGRRGRAVAVVDRRTNSAGVQPPFSGLSDGADTLPRLAPLPVHSRS